MSGDTRRMCKLHTDSDPNRESNPGPESCEAAVLTTVSSMVAQWLALLPHSARDPGSIPDLGHCLYGVCTFSLCLHGFPPGAPVSSLGLKDVLVRCIGMLNSHSVYPNRRWNVATRRFSQKLHCSVNVSLTCDE